MTVQWTLSGAEVRKAIEKWLKDNRGIEAGGAKIRVCVDSSGECSAVITGVIESASLGPYR